MQHLALYRKYRPATFDDVVGQEHIVTTLKNEVASGAPAHAYLFTGSRGTGKTSCAKIMAKALNCPNRTDANPCCVCNICKGIDDGSVMDVVEIDAASNNGVDNIRDLRDEANFTPSAGKYRVYIIDEVHMLSTGAFNALLKIMEEPPAHVIFILATTEVHKIPATILSRCQRFDFHRIPAAQLSKRLMLIAEKESITLSDDAAGLMARLADGGMRDAISLLDLCSSYSQNITVEIVSEASGTIGQQHLFEISSAIIEQNTGKSLGIMQELSRQSMDAGRLCEQLLGHFRNLMLVRSTTDAANFIEAMPTDMQQLTEQAKKLELEQIIFYLDTLSEALGKMSRTAESRIELEIAIVTMCNLKFSVDTKAVLARLEKLENLVCNLQLACKGQTLSQTAIPDNMSVATKKVAVSSTKIDIDQQTVNSNDAEIQSAQDTKVTGEVARFSQWQEVLAKLEKVNGALYGALASSKAFSDGNYVLIDCKDDFFLKLMRENEYSKESLKQCILDVTGKRCNIGPYKTTKSGKPQKAKTDPLEDFIKDLDLPEDIVTIE